MKQKDRQKNSDRNIYLLAIFGFVILIVAQSVFGYVMSSPSYRIQSDSINVGGVRQTSNSYYSEDTIGEVVVGISSSTSYILRAGYQEMLQSSISLSLSTTSVQLLPNIPGTTGGSASGTYNATVITDNTGGYSLYVNASTSPALKSGSYSFNDYTPSVVGTPDFNWSVLSTTSEFGFTPGGTDIAQLFKDNSGSCNSGTNDTADKCWYNFSSSAQAISTTYSPTQQTGNQTAVRLKAESGSSNNQHAGIYTGHIINTAVAN